MGYRRDPLCRPPPIPPIRKRQYGLDRASNDARSPHIARRCQLCPSPRLHVILPRCHFHSPTVTMSRGKEGFRKPTPPLPPSQNGMGRHWGCWPGMSVGRNGTIQPEHRTFRGFVTPSALSCVPANRVPITPTLPPLTRGSPRGPHGGRLSDLWDCLRRGLTTRRPQPINLVVPSKVVPTPPVSEAAIESPRWPLRFYVRCYLMPYFQGVSAHPRHPQRNPFKLPDPAE